MNEKILKSAAIVPDYLYVERAADRQLRAIVNEMGRPGYVLVARQMGKTNLLLNMKRERSEDIVLYHDLSSRFDSARRWFRNIIDMLIEAYGELLPASVSTILEQRKDSRFEANLEYDRHLRLILREVRKKVIIILDEIDALVNTSYSDVILSQIRSMYFSRANYPEYENLTYVLSGVIEPTDLIKDKNISPFNIGEKIYLENFTFSEFNVFLNKASLEFNEIVAARVFDWTNGNPRITWEVCAELERIYHEVGCVTERDVDQVVLRIYLNEFDRAPVDHIRTLVKSDPKIQDAIIEIRFGKSNALDQSVKNKLYLAGITDSAGGEVKIANKVVDYALSDSWLKSLGSSAPSVFALANSYYGEKKYHAVIEKLESLVGASNDDHFPTQERQILALSYLYTGKFGSAARELKLCLSEQSDPSVAQYLRLELGIALAAEKDLDEAVKELNSAVTGPDPVLTTKARLELASIALLSEDRVADIAGIASCEQIIQDVSIDMAESGRERNSILVLAYYLRSRLLSKVGQEIEALAEIERALKIADDAHKPGLLLAKANMSRKRQVRVSLAREIIEIIKLRSLVVSVDDDPHLQFCTEHIAQIFVLLSKENLVQEFKDFAGYYVRTSFVEPIIEFVGLKHLYAEFDDSENQSNYIEILIWAIRYFNSDRIDWRERLETYREIVMVYQGNEKGDFRNRYLGELAVHETDADAFFDSRHVEALTVIGLACVQTPDWRLGRQLFDIWEKYRTLASSDDIHSLLMEYIGLLGIKSGQLFVAEVRDVALRILKTIKEHEGQFRKSSVSDLVSMIRREAEATARIWPKDNPSEYDIFRELGRNDWVIVQYPSELPQKIKFKHVREDLHFRRCKLIDVLTDK